MALGNSVELFGIKETLDQLRAVRPEAFKAMVDDIKQITSPAVTAIESAIPKIAPLSGRMRNGKTGGGMTHSGRSAWGVPQVKTKVTPAARAYFGTEAKLVQIQTTTSGKAYGIELADMAGRGSGRGRSPKSETRVYAYKGTTRKHRLNGQGQAMIRALPGSKGSRFIYPAVEDKFPQMQAQVLKSLEKAAAKINRKLDRI